MTSGGQERLIGRRAVLRGAGGAALAGAVGIAGAPGARAGGGRSADVIVVGAGFAGVTAARELRSAGLRPVLLEARDRIGGRTRTADYEGQVIEYGGQWVSDAHTNVMAELRRYGIGTRSGGPTPLRAFFPAAAGGQREVDFAEANDRLNSLLARLFEGSRDYFPRPRDPLFAADVLARHDPLSLRDRLDRLALPEEDGLWLGGVTSVFSGGSSALGGLTALAQSWAGGGHTGQGWNELNEHLVQGGTGALLTAVLADARADLRLNSPVAAVAEEPGRVVVTTWAGARYTAPAVVVAVPVNVWRTISFSPGLPAVHAQATRQGVGVPNVTKLLLRLRGDHRLPFALGPEGSPMSQVVPQAELPDGDQLVVAFSVDPALDPTNLPDVQAKLRTILPGATVRDCRAWSWGRDRWAMGGWAMRRPGQLLRQVPAIHRPHGRVVFASGDVPAAWHGYIEGAIEAGVLGARQALALV
ncbi:flavin monoamine oxidase family protein [Saccharothrix sp. HUAS TT1]|uniref:flavin monoamine oxidase family protein n=1 Tax=unclassified Saccharothrix TaxID=2593673 RepID=UPI00345C5975